MERKRPPVKTDGRENIYIKEMVFKKPPADQGHLNPKTDGSPMFAFTNVTL